ARLLRAEADGLSLGPARLQSLVREPEAARDRPRDGDGRAPATPRRARRRDEPRRDPRDDGADRQAPRRRRLHDPGHRARHARRRGHLRPRRRARLRRQDRRRVVRRCGHRPAGGRGVPRAEEGADEMSLLRISGINTYYGQIHILQGVDIEVGGGELVSLLGGNASGKSTTLKTILGLVRPRTGAVEFAGEDVTDRTTSYRIGRGMAIVPENRRLFGPMTVLENLEMGAYLNRDGEGRKEDFDRVYS